MGLEGPVQLETTIKPNAQTVYYVELMAEKSEAGSALMRIINRIENQHKCKAIYRVHADRAPELTGDIAKKLLEDHGITVTSTAGYDKMRMEEQKEPFCGYSRRRGFYCHRT